MGFKHDSGMIQFRRLTLAARVGEGDMVGGEDRGRDWARVVAMGTREDSRLKGCSRGEIRRQAKWRGGGRRWWC